MIISFDPVGKAEIEMIQKCFNRKFPSDYYNFLKNHNGFFILYGFHFEVYQKDYAYEDLDFESLYGIGIKDYNLEKINEKFLDKIKHIPDAFIIGDDIDGNLFVLICNSNKSHVYYWDVNRLNAKKKSPQTPSISEVNECGNLYFVAESFQKFHKIIIDNIYPD